MQHMKKWLEKNWLAVLAIVMLAGLFVPMVTVSVVLPYAYYQLTNWVVVGAALTLAWRAKEQDSRWVIWLFVFVAVVFNPLAPMYLSAFAWQVADVIGIVLFLTSFFLMRGKKS